MPSAGLAIADAGPAGAAKHSGLNLQSGTGALANAGASSGDGRTGTHRLSQATAALTRGYCCASQLEAMAP